MPALKVTHHKYTFISEAIVGKQLADVDTIMWMLPLGSENDFQQYVNKSNDFIKNKNLIIILADQIPMYLQIRHRLVMVLCLYIIVYSVVLKLTKNKNKKPILQKNKRRFKVCICVGLDSKKTTR